MSSVQRIVPPKPTEHRLVRRKKSWQCGLATAGLALLAVMLAIDDFATESSFATWGLVGCVVLMCISGSFALIFRFTERPTEITVRRWPDEPPLIH